MHLLSFAGQLVSLRLSAAHLGGACPCTRSRRQGRQRGRSAPSCPGRASRSPPAQSAWLLRTCSPGTTRTCAGGLRYFQDDQPDECVRAPHCISHRQQAGCTARQQKCSIFSGTRESKRRKQKAKAKGPQQQHFKPAPGIFVLPSTQRTRQQVARDAHLGPGEAVQDVGLALGGVRDGVLRLNALPQPVALVAMRDVHVLHTCRWRVLQTSRWTSGETPSLQPQVHSTGWFNARC